MAVSIGPPSMLYESQSVQIMSTFSHLSSLLIDAGQVDARNELNGRWGVRVAIAAVDVDAVDSVFMCTLYIICQHNGSASGVKGRPIEDSLQVD